MNINDNDDDLEFVNQLSSVSKQLNLTNSPTLNSTVNIKKSNNNTPTLTSTTTTTTTTANNNYLQQQNNRIVDDNDNQPIITDEDYAAELQSQFNKEQTNIDTSIGIIDTPEDQDSLYLPEIIASSDYARFVDLKKTATIIKAIALLLMVFSLMSYFSQGWWLIFSGGLVFCPVGYYSAHYLQRRLFLFFIFYLNVDIIFRLAFLFSHVSYLGGFGVLISLLFCGLEGYMVYFCFHFYKRMPRDGRETFREFFLNDHGIFSL
ncbi:hypothetical protein DLAC_06916 [Tieghemostelium lacteum]|uniref:Transmembrane protein n=1 Tax=Tieghemostelium lacteum TaxID=361077 RepID=A0A151ZDP3_TIELA|nr:hypothetical protein DLAC_06916 [Tieghemostelium lacteum]|eukprot:KYQ92078.1 hypothetical protein DLAC_06916 [Tieghemostelium lacteum]